MPLPQSKQAATRAKPALPAASPFLGGGEQLFREAALGQREHRQQRLRGVPGLLLPGCATCSRSAKSEESGPEV